MIKSTLALIVIAGLSLGSTVAIGAERTALDGLQGKWTVNKTSQNGQSYTQKLEITKDQLKLTIVGPDNDVRFLATGTVKTEKLGPFSIIKVTNIMAGRSESETQAVNEDRTNIYMLDYDTLTLVSNIDRARENQPPSLDVYRKSSR